VPFFRKNSAARTLVFVVVARSTEQTLQNKLSLSIQVGAKSIVPKFSEERKFLISRSAALVVVSTELRWIDKKYTEWIIESCLEIILVRERNLSLSCGAQRNDRAAQTTS
jgi:hypothetical protein